MCANPAWVKGVGYRGEEQFFGDSDKAVWPSALEAAQEAYQMAGITNPRKELDVAEVYNPFTYQEMLFYECFGFCEFGQAPGLVSERRLRPGRRAADLPVGRPPYAPILSAQPGLSARPRRPCR